MEGEVLDGEGGQCVFGALLPASRSVSLKALPIGFAHGVRLQRSVSAGQLVRWDDVEIEETDAVRFRREMVDVCYNT